MLPAALCTLRAMAKWKELYKLWRNFQDKQMTYAKDSLATEPPQCYAVTLAQVSY